MGRAKSTYTLTAERIHETIKDAGERNYDDLILEAGRRNLIPRLTKVEFAQARLMAEREEKTVKAWIEENEATHYVLHNYCKLYKALHNLRNKNADRRKGSGRSISRSPEAFTAIVAAVMDSCDTPPSKKFRAEFLAKLSNIDLS